MPPHCDTMDGPVVKACQKALIDRDVRMVLPWVPEISEEEVKRAFERVISIINKGDDLASNVAMYWFYETVVRLHRQGEGEPFTGIKPSGVNWGPVPVLTDKAIETGDPREVIKMLQNEVEHEILERFNRLRERSGYDPSNISEAREYVEAELGFVLFSHKLWSFIESGGASLEHHE